MAAQFLRGSSCCLEDGQPVRLRVLDESSITGTSGVKVRRLIERWKEASLILLGNVVNFNVSSLNSPSGCYHLDGNGSNIARRV